MFAAAQRVHFIGIGGIGMSGIAEILLSVGFPVSGSDIRASAATDRLQKLGATIFIGHTADQVRPADVVVTSSAVSKSNPEVLEALARKIPVIQRAEMLAELMRLKYGIAIAGMHGKTTTTSMIAAVMDAGGLDPTVVVGGRVDLFGSNARAGQSRYLVAEADESDRSFLKLSPILAVVTNLDREHMENYKGMADVEQCFVDFMNKVPFYGAATACIDDPMLRSILPRVQRRVMTYGEHPDADFRLVMLPKQDGSRAVFEVNVRGIVLGPFHLHVPGRHNVLNATAAIAIGVELGVPPAQIAAGLKRFTGVDRRFQTRGVERGVTVVDDYGHHPTEIRATLAAARDCGFKRVHVLFQPHRYSRTRELMGDFATAFKDADRVEVLDIYAASEEPIEGVNAQALVRAMRAAGTDAYYAPGFSAGAARLAEVAAKGEAIVTLGAGTISQAGPLVLQALQLPI
ncbi:MAG: UDP-N-acetylmuramate--L-alanine ligase [Janthinobacterium lividum]